MGLCVDMIKTLGQCQKEHALHAGPHAQEGPQERLQAVKKRLHLQQDA